MFLNMITINMNIAMMKIIKATINIYNRKINQVKVRYMSQVNKITNTLHFKYLIKKSNKNNNTML